MSPGTFAVIVAYRPDAGRLSALCRCLHECGAAVIVVDNTEAPSLVPGALPGESTLLTVGRNAGIAAAQNIGIEEALRRGAQAVALFDQDSNVTPDLLPALAAWLGPGMRVVGPACYDDESGAEMPAVRLNRWGLPRPVCAGRGDEPLRADILIASGTLAEAGVFREAGSMDASLFIDGVDTDWCLRCRARGIGLWVVPQARMRHRVGIKPLRVGPFTLLVHGPERCYYQVRNSLAMLRRPHVPLLYGLADAFSIVASRLLLLAAGPGSAGSYSARFAAGLRDGMAALLRGRPL